MKEEDSSKPINNIMKAEEVKKQKFYASFISGGLGGIIAKTCIAPLDRTKTVFQVKNFLIRYQKKNLLIKKC